MPATLRSLLDRASAGDPDAFIGFYDATVVTASRLATAAAPRDSDVDDVLTTAYASAWSERASFQTCGRSPLAWLLVFVHTSARHASGAAPTI